MWRCTGFLHGNCRSEFHSFSLSLSSSVNCVPLAPFRFHHCWNFRPIRGTFSRRAVVGDDQIHFQASQSENNVPEWHVPVSFLCFPGHAIQQPFWSTNLTNRELDTFISRGPAPEFRIFLARPSLIRGGHAVRCQLTNYLGHLISFFLLSAIYLCSGSNCPKISRVYMLHSFFPGKSILMQGSGVRKPSN